MKVEYIKDNKIYSFDNILSKQEYDKFYNGQLDGKYEREYVVDDSIIDTLKEELIKVIDLYTKNEITKGVLFDGKIFSMSIEAQINWSNILNIPDNLFPLPIMTIEDELYNLKLIDKTNFYLTCLGHKNSKLQNGNILKQQLKSLNTESDINDFKNNHPEIFN